MKSLQKLILFAIMIFISSALYAQPVEGKIETFKNFSSKYVQPRNVDVWLPANYDAHKKYAVIYMQDGQMLFDSTKTWNYEAWHVDKTLTELMAENKIKNCIVVGIWNNGTYRASEYFPQKALAYIPEDSNKTQLLTIMADTAMADNYLEFMVKELKPFIDSNFSTWKDQKNTFIIGSSFGGLIALYAICEYPSVFYGAACMSTHWTGVFRAENNPIPAAITQYLNAHLPSPKDHKIYFDHGTETLDKMYGSFQDRVDSLMQQKGYTSENFMSKKFPGADHSEASWSKRFYIPATFLLGKK